MKVKIPLIMFVILVMSCQKQLLLPVDEQTYHYNHEKFEDNKRSPQATYFGFETVQWNIDHLQMGVGGDTSWGRLVHEEYTITPKKYKYSFIIQPLKK